MAEDPFILDFLDYIRSEKGLSPHTIEAYGRDVRSFAAYIHGKEWKQVDSEAIVGFLSHLQQKSYASSSICRILVAIKVFFRFLRKEGVVSLDLGRYFETPKLWQLIPEVLTIEEVDALLAQPVPSDFLGARDKAFLELLYATGMRVSELCRLRICDLQDEVVKVSGKGKKERLIPVGKKAIAAVDHYLKQFRNDGKSDLLFVSRTGKALSRITVWERVKTYGRAAAL